MPSYTTSTYRDRTAEFQQIADRLRQQASPSTSGAPEANGLARKSSTPGQFAPQSEFAQRAARIGLQIHGTTQKLHRLAQLAKTTSMFDDPARDIAELTTVIKQDIQGLNASISDLQSLSHSGWGDTNRQSSVHSETVVDNLRARLKDATTEFKDVLTRRADNLKAHDDRRSLYGLGGKQLMPRSTLRGSQSSLFGGEAKGSLQGSQNGEGSSSQADSAHAPLLAVQQQLAAPQQDTYLASRAEALQNVEKTIHELGTIFQQLADMVQAQAETVVRIDENVDETLSNVDAAQTYLLKYLKGISSNRWLVLKVFFVLMLFLTIFLVFIV